MHPRSRMIGPWAHNLCEKRCRLQLSSRAQRRRILFSSERSISGVSSHKSGLRCDQEPKLLRQLTNEMLEEEELRKRLPLASDKC